MKFSDIVDDETGKPLFDKLEGSLEEGDQILISLHNIYETEVKAKVTVEFLPGRDRTEIDSNFQEIQNSPHVESYKDQ